MKAAVKHAAELPENLRRELIFQVGWLAWEWPEVMRKLKSYWERFRHWDEVSSVLPKEGRVLDVGCGVTSVLNLLSRDSNTCAYERVGIDPLMRWYRDLFPLDPSVTWIEGDIQCTVFVNPADVIFCTNVLDHVAYPQKALMNMKCSLAPSGILVLAVDFWPRPRQRDIIHPHAFTYSQVMSLVREAGFEIEAEWTGPGSALRTWVEGKPVGRSSKREVMIIAH